ncbi:MAG: hypothetical protein V1869_00750 [Candidatus Omnitrophota bacterium]
MKKDCGMIIFGAGLSLMLAFSSRAFAAPKFDFTPSTELGADEIAKKSSVLYNSSKEEATRPAVVYLSRGLKDPFKPFVTEKKAEDIKNALKEVKPLPEMKVQGLIWGGVFPQAIINNKVVKVGDSIGEVKITAISAKGVTVLFANMQHELSSPVVTGQQQDAKNKGGSDEN